MPLHAPAIKPPPTQPSRTSTDALRRPRQRLLILAAGALWVLASIAVAGTEEGVAAFEAGNYAKAFEELRALGGDAAPRARAYLGEIYMGAIPKKKDYEKARKLLRKAYNDGYKSAGGSLGLLYEHGRSVEPDKDRAVNFYREAAQAGSAQAQTNLGLAYKYGTGTEIDLEKAVLWLTRAAKQGVAAAQAVIAEMYASDEGVQKDPRKASLWASKAAKSGNARGQFVYGHILRKTNKNSDAYRWNRRAALQGQPQAVRDLGLALLKGDVVGSHPVLGAAWMMLASGLDSQYDDDLFQDVVEQLSDHQHQRMVELAEKISRNPEQYAPKVKTDGAADASSATTEGEQ